MFLFNFLLLFESFQPFVKSFHILTFSLLRRLTKLRSKMRKIFSEWKNYTKKLSLSFVEKLGFRKNKKRVGEKKKRIVRDENLLIRVTIYKPVDELRNQVEVFFFFHFLIFCLNGSVILKHSLNLLTSEVLKLGGGCDPFKGHQIFFNGRRTLPELSLYHRFNHSL
jgi:hypothetical protein